MKGARLSLLRQFRRKPRRCRTLLPQNMASFDSPNVPYHKYYSSTRPSSFAWWNPFSRGSSGSDSSAQLGSARTAQGDDASSPRRIQERKDATLALLALEFRRLSLEHPSKKREDVIDMAFESLDAKDLDNKTTLQLRHELQTALEGQVVELFQAFGRVDENFPFDLEEPGDAGNAMLDQLLQLELERTIDELANTNPTRAPKGSTPKTFLQIKRGALETLIDRRKSLSAVAATFENVPLSEGEESDTSKFIEKQVSWVDADQFGYHETIDDDRNRQIRHFQTINLCRSSKLRDDWGYSVVALQSSIAGAGRGVFVDGYAKAGSILAFQPGEVWSKEHLVNLSVEVERQLEKNDHYQMSLRPDDFMIDSRKSPYTVLTGNRSNIMALGHVVNHPSPTNPPNCLSVMLNFTQNMEYGESNKRYIPNTYARPRSLTTMGSLWDQEAVDMHGMCLIATRDICNEELFYDYRLVTSQLPSWYHRFEDNAFENPVDEEPNDATK